MKKNTKLSNAVKAFSPLITALVCSVIVYALVYQDQSVFEIYSSETMLKTLLPGFPPMLFSISKINGEITQTLVTLAILVCVFAVFFFLLRGTSLAMNVLLSIMYIGLGTYTGFSNLTDIKS